MTSFDQLLHLFLQGKDIELAKLFSEVDKDTRQEFIEYLTSVIAKKESILQ